MATSGRVESGRVNIGGRGNNFVFANWQLAGQDYGRNVSAINWQMYFHFDGADAQLDNGYFDGGAGRRYANGGRVYNFARNYSTRDLGIASGSFEIGHDAQGNANLYISPGITVYQTGSPYGQGTFQLPQIPRDAYLTNLSQDITDEDSAWVEFSNAGGYPVNAWFEFPNNGGGRFLQYNSVGSRFTWPLDEAARNQLRAVLANQNAAVIRYVIETNKNGSYGYDYRDRTYSIINANPTFADFDYVDTDATTIGITGNPYVLVQGKSNLKLTVPATKKMVANKQATSVNYVATVDGVVDTEPFAATGAVNFPIGAVNSSGSKTMSVRAIDSRGNSTTVNKQVEVIPYAIPDLIYTAQRQNNFENVTEIKLSGTFSPVVIDSIAKNNIVTGSLKYRKRQDGGSWSTWQTVTFGQSAGQFTAPTIYEDLVNSSLWDFEIQVSDKFGTATESFSVDRGVPIMMVGDAGRIGVGKMPPNTGRIGLYLTPDDNLWLQMYAVGDVYQTTNSASPVARFGGTWVNVGTSTVGTTTINWWKRTA